MEKTPFLLGNETNAIDIQRPSFFRRLLEDLATTSFWENVAKTLLNEAIAAFMRTLGGVFLYYGEQRSNKALKTNQTILSPTPEVSNRAFGGYQSPTYQNPSYPVSAQPAGDARFPGFGSSPR
jgi:hypothetical protein